METLRYNTLIGGRSTGRTTRMLEEAIRLSAEGRAVYVMMHTRTAEAEFKHRVEMICERKGIEVPAIKYETWESLGGHRGVDLVQQKMFGAHPNCCLFIDHHFYQHHFEHILAGFHQWDKVEFDDSVEAPRKPETE